MQARNEAGATADGDGIGLERFAMVQVRVGRLQHQPALASGLEPATDARDVTTTRATHCDSLLPTRDRRLLPHSHRW